MSIQLNVNLMFKLKFCGYFIDANGVCPLKEKVNVLQQFPLPITKQKLRKFLSLINFYRRFIPSCIIPDASNTAGQQQINKHWQPIVYFSKKLQPAEKKYCTFDRELLSIYSAVKHFAILW